MKIPPISGYLKIKHTFCIEKNSHHQARAANDYKRIKLFTKFASNRETIHIISDTSCIFVFAHFRREKRERMNCATSPLSMMKVACLSPLASSAPKTMDGRKSPILGPRSARFIGMSIVYDMCVKKKKIGSLV